MSDLSWLNPTPHAIAVYASQPLSPVVTQHSLPSGRYSLLGPGLHRQDRTSFAWRTHSITSSATMSRIDDQNPRHRRSFLSWFRSPALRLVPFVHDDDLRRLDCIARMAEIANGADALARPLQHDEIGRLTRRIARIAGNNCRVPVDKPRLQVPVVHTGVIAEISAHLRAPGHARLAHQIEPHVVRQHVADGIEVARIEAVHIGRQPCLVSLAKDRRRRVAWLVRRRAQALAPAMRGGLH